MISIYDIHNFINNIIFTSYHFIILKYFNDLPQCAVPSAITTKSLPSFIFSFFYSLYNDTYKKKLNRKDI